MNVFNIGDWIYIIQTQDGAYGANNTFGQIINESAKNCDCGVGIDGVQVKLVNGEKWAIGSFDNIRIRHCTKEDILNINISQYNKPIIHEDLSYLISILENHNII